MAENGSDRPSVKPVNAGWHKDREKDRQTGWQTCGYCELTLMTHTLWLQLADWQTEKQSEMELVSCNR